ncbi:hypothetical protein K3165_00500 [Qipengyuania sp. 1XM1-15A]|uniref:hypothetical protein n=1 Tax=Qipengyuania xiamenensis TaxID=2867237 RepID=UPI001C87E93E|nr:hypothetical protein [Qipengyuania xiamenensis]MBX7531395.1 hypothetical protein [Qipengyuania xiamenensis]
MGRKILALMAPLMALAVPAQAQDVPIADICIETPEAAEAGERLLDAFLARMGKGTEEVDPSVLFSEHYSQCSAGLELSEDQDTHYRELVLHSLIARSSRLRLKTKGVSDEFVEGVLDLERSGVEGEAHTEALMELYLSETRQGKLSAEAEEVAAELLAIHSSAVMAVERLRSEP